MGVKNGDTSVPLESFWIDEVNYYEYFGVGGIGVGVVTMRLSGRDIRGIPNLCESPIDYLCTKT